MKKENMNFKTLDLAISDEIEGKVEAVFSVFNTVDSDEDVVLPNSIKSAWGDKGVPMVWSHDWKDVIGRGDIVQDDEKAVFKGQFIMDTERVRDAFHTVKAMGDLQQWSFGYQVTDSENGDFKKDGQTQEVRYIKSATVFEVSPVLVGANQETHTLAVKEDNSNAEVDSEPKSNLRFTDEADNVLITINSFIDRAKELTSLRLEKKKKLSKGATESLVNLQDRIQEVYNELDMIIGFGSDESDVEVEIDELDAEVEETQEADTLIADTTRVLGETLDPDII